MTTTAAAAFSASISYKLGMDALSVQMPQQHRNGIEDHLVFSTKDAYLPSLRDQCH